MCWICIKYISFGGTIHEWGARPVDDWSKLVEMVKLVSLRIDLTALRFVRMEQIARLLWQIVSVVAICRKAQKRCYLQHRLQIFYTKIPEKVPHIYFISLYRDCIQVVVLEGSQKVSKLSLPIFHYVEQGFTPFLLSLYTRSNYFCKLSYCLPYNNRQIITKIH